MTNNFIQLKGNLGADPAIRKMQDGRDVATLSIAVTDRYYDKEEKAWRDTEVQWFRAVAFGALEISEARHLGKGALVHVTGRVKHSSYKDKEGNEKHSIEVIVSSLEEIVRRKHETDRAGQEAA